MGRPTWPIRLPALRGVLRCACWSRTIGSAVLRIEHELKNQLEAYRRYTNVKDIRVLGAIGVLELHEMPTPERVQSIVRETGVWLRPFDRYLYTMPPFVTPPEEILRITQAMGRLSEL